MCKTCGCSDASLPAPAAVGAHHDHDHNHGHGHQHGAGSQHEHSHAHENGHSAGGRILKLQQDVLAKNDELARLTRARLAERRVLALNLVSAPGAGKTTLLERTLLDLGREFTISVIEGDQATDHDARRVRAAGGRAVQVNTGAGCHLDAAMVARALEQLDPPAGSLVFIENVGNLVCPALFDLGENAKVVICSVPEGDDKPAKYPHMFRASSLMVLNKIDLLPHVPFEIDRCLRFATQVNPGLTVIPLSAARGTGLDEWYSWVRERAA
jgi:hydrogenase nickel incorporation protein HypB